MSGFTVADFLAHLDHADGHSRAAGASDLPPGYRLVHVVEAGAAFPPAEARDEWRLRPWFVPWPIWGDRQAEDSWEQRSIAHHGALPFDDAAEDESAHCVTIGRA